MLATLTIIRNNSNTRWRWKRAEFQQITQSSVFTEGRDAELIRGDIYPVEPPGPLHSGSVNPIADLLRDAFGTGFYVRTEQPLVTNDADSQPQPDIVVCVGSSTDYRRRFPEASEARLVVEISDTTLEKDRTIKQQDYATAGIVEYWIVNLRETQLEVYREPDINTGIYRSRRIYTPGETVTPIHATNSPLFVAELLGE